MFGLFVRPIRCFLRAFTSADTPGQLALGVALGMMIGLAPKGNLIAVGLGILLLATRVNLGTGLLAATAFSWVGMLVDPFTGRIGHAILTTEWLQGTGAFLYDLPLMPWTGFNNTVVLGNLLLGIWLFYPVYKMSRAVFERWQPWAIEKARDSRFVRLALGAKTVEAWRPL